ncbi:RagB/SusD family nutrient uptake outer membrane protein [Plebeiibacterium marinum]|uniref:RagB/SusD family nutrient uptake outer membrane protein n=1 Tax=Plebeiibacterium marinum TaxID=2992111 RepID=A0AAE3SLL4_9BACT|nr:RagB/SusD family nutrient uptake outer membrane protein [Plebeiobacterium marinum]MCW3807758.1 RagB/SusD family nutrient uptake outer membrane protein [Plebeiobacterium marinum]
MLLYKMKGILKNRLLIIGLVLGSVILPSCKDWLYLEPQDAIIVQEYWQSKEEVHAAAMGIYSSMVSDHPWKFFTWGEIRGEMVKSDYASTNYAYVNNGDILPTLNVVKWAPLYRTINYCNNLIAQAPQVLDRDPSFTQADLNVYLSEAYAVRALMYFYLTRFFQEVPLVLEATLTDEQEARVPKSSQQVILKQILEDLELAEKYAVRSYGDLESDKGRITVYAINTIQANVNLWTNDYDKSIEAANKVIASGNYGLVPGDDLWLTTLFHETNSIEGIFELQYSLQNLNPFYNNLSLSRLFYANADIMDTYFPINIYMPADSADIRGDRGSFRSSRNYNLWKYIGINRSVAKEQDDATSNFIVYRYADVLLMKAEALAMRGNGGDFEESLRLIKLIRARANAADETQYIMDGEVLDTRSLISYIVNERAREFMFEGKRWLDVLRNARRNNYERMDLIEDMVLVAAPYNRMQIIKNKYQDTLSHYFPIPQDDINAGYPVLEQNPFYEY